MTDEIISYGLLVATGGRGHRFSYHPTSSTTVEAQMEDHADCNSNKSTLATGKRLMVWLVCN